MARSPVFQKTFVPHHGNPVDVAPDVVRVTAPNRGPFTFEGTNSYIIGSDTLALIDPGPDNDMHLAALERAIAGRPVSHIFITHTHIDHSPLARPLADRTGAKIVGAAPHFPARDLHLGETNVLDASADRDHAPERILTHGERIDLDGFSIEAVETPGHTANHLAFAIPDKSILFSGDHVMAWATSIVAPPDGSMRAYMASLDVLLERDDHTYLPGHGGSLQKPKTFVRGLKAHRKMRERAIMERIKKGDRTIARMVAEIYRDTDPRLHGAAGLSVFAHLEDLLERGLIETDGPPSLDGAFRPA